MLNNFENYYMEIVEYSKEELTKVVGGAFFVLNDALKKEFTDHDFILNVMLDLLDGFMVCDGPVNQDETDLYNSVFETSFTKEELNDLVELHKNEKDARLAKLEKFKLKDEEFRNSLFLFGSCICAIDGSINVKEQEYLESHVRIDIGKNNGDLLS